MMHFNIQPTLENDTLLLLPLQENDFESLYSAASDPGIWEQHPSNDRWKREVFQLFFEGAINCKGAFKIVSKATGEVIGSTRLYDYNEADDSLFMGYTFYVRKYWGNGTNHAVKKLLLAYLFQHVSKVYFQIGAKNLRSQISIGRLGATKLAAQEVAYYGEGPNLNFIYVIEKKTFMEHISVSKAGAADWQTIQELGRATFFETFAAGNTAADMAKYLEETFNDAKVQAELQEPDSLFYIAWDDKVQVGYLKVNTGTAQTELQDDNSLEIERIYVKSSYHGKKVGQILYEKALEVARNQQKTYIWLGVWEENPRAIRFYEKNGFIAFDKHIFKVGDDEQIDIMMKKELA